MVHKKFSKSRRNPSNKRGNRSISGKSILQKAELERSKMLARYSSKVWFGSCPRILINPIKPLNGAALSIRQIPSAFNVETGLTAGSIIATPTNPVLWAIAFTLADLSQVATFAALFDQYRVDKIQYRFTPRTNATNVATSGALSHLTPSLGVLIDRDDANAIATRAACFEYDTLQPVPSFSGYDLEFVPSITRSLFASGAFSGYEVVPSNEVWIDMANTAVPHYGVKGYIDFLTPASTDTYAWDITCAVIVSFRNGR